MEDNTKQAMVLASRFSEIHFKSKSAAASAIAVRSACSGLIITKEEDDILVQALSVLNRIADASSDRNARIYVEKLNSPKS